MNLLVILLIILSIFIICSLFCTDHFTNINSLGIKYNAYDVMNPKQLQRPTPKELTLREQINAELESHPLMFDKQIYSSYRYPNLPPMEKMLQKCTNNSDCLLPTTECKKDIYNRQFGVGTCQLSRPHTTVFDVEY